MKSPVELRYITLAQIIGCCLVIFGHSFPFVSAIPNEVDNLRLFIYTFHMPLFVWCSGFLFAHTRQSEEKTFFQYTKQRTIKLLIPYFIISIIGIVPKILASSVLNDTLTMDAMQIVRAFLVPREGIWGHFWFLPMIFIIGVLGFLFDRISKNKWFWFFVCGFAFVLSFCKASMLEWFGLNDVIHFLLFFSLGVLCARIRLVVHSLSAGIIAFAFSIILFLFLPERSLAMMHVKSTMLAVLMTLAIVQLCKSLEKRIIIDRKSLIAQTYQIFILSWPCQLVAGIIIERILHLSWMVFIPVVFVAGVTLPLVLLKLIDWIEEKTNTRYISFILGR